MKKKRVLAMLMALTMTASMDPMPVSAAEEVTYKDGTYTKTVTVQPNEDYDFDAYELGVDVTIADGKISNVAFSGDNDFGNDEFGDNEMYSLWALNGRGKYTGVATQIIEKNGVVGVDVVSTATCTSNAIISAVSAVLEDAEVEEVVDKTALQTVMDISNLTETDYTADSWSSLKKAIEDAQAVLDKTDATQAEVDSAAEAVNAAKADLVKEEKKEVTNYVLMNIPYAEFYAAEGVSGVDAVTTATVKTYNMGKAAGSYHNGYIDENPKSGDEAILGVTYPVYVEDMSVLADLTQVKAEDTATITVASGKSATTTKEVSGADILFASGNYAYYVMDGEPTSYKTLTVNEDGSFSFSAASGEVVEGTATAEVKYACNYTNIELIVTADEIVNASAANAIVVTTSDGNKYALRHVENEWDRTDLGWNWTDLDGNGLGGKTITNVKYYLKNADGTYTIHSYNTNVTMKQNPGTVTAEFTDANTITLTDLPTDIENAKATVKTKVGRGETATVIAEDVAVEKGTITTTEAAVDGTYVITIVSDKFETKR